MQRQLRHGLQSGTNSKTKGRSVVSYSTHTITGQLKNDLEFEADVEVSWDQIDVGIGPYEFWGSKYMDVNMVWDPIDFHIDTLTVYSEDGDYIMECIENNREITEVQRQYFVEADEYISLNMDSFEPDSTYLSDQFQDH